MRDQIALDRAKSLRLQQTPPETHLWLALRAKRFQGVKFRRQKVIGPYIADFACRDPMLVIELDASKNRLIWCDFDAMFDGGVIGRPARMVFC